MARTTGLWVLASPTLASSWGGRKPPIYSLPNLPPRQGKSADMNTSDNSPEYYRMREAQEQEMADKAATEEGRAVHQALADRYRELAEEAETQGP